MDSINHFTTRHFPDSLDNTATMRLSTDDEGRFIVNIEADSGDSAGLYLDRESRRELIAVLLKTL